MSFTKINHYEKEYADTHHECALTVTEGVENQPVVNPYFVRKKKRALTTEEYVEGILQGNITTLSQAITLVESSTPAHYAQAQEIIEKCLPHAGKSVRIGITGVPGAGKSTFIEAVGNMVTSLKHKLAVLAIDPSSERSGGSILGDKTRMESISSNPKVFIRPSPSAGSLGGVARNPRETLILREAAGFDVINMDLIAGLPTDTFDSFAASLDAVCGLSPENITVHSLSLKRAAALFREGKEGAAGETERMIDYAHQKLAEHGYIPYYLYRQKNTADNQENTGYAKPGTESLYNTYIMEELQTILAVGAGASTKLVDRRTGRIKRITNLKYPYVYLDRFNDILENKREIFSFFV